MDIYESLAYISEKAFPKIKQDWTTYTIDNDNTFFMVVDWVHPLGDYVSDNYRQGLNALLQVIESGELQPNEKITAEKLLIALATNFVNLHSDLPQNKQEIAYSFYANNPVFRAATDMYAVHASKLISNIITYAYFKLDQGTIEAICNNSISNTRSTKKVFYQLIDRIRDDFRWNHSISSWVSGQNALKYWELGILIDTIFPELHFFETKDGSYILDLKKDIDELKELEPLEKKFDAQQFWLDDELLPDYFEFNYLYPNGLNGDIVHYLLEEYGETVQTEATLWHGKISSEHKTLFEVFAASTLYISSDDSFQKIFEYHIPSIISARRSVMNQTKLAWFGRFNTWREKCYQYKNEQKEKKTILYGKLINEGRTSPKWKSEAQLFAVVSNLYPDAVYQYHTSWLGMQSLDIYIPSVSVGIEYQGIQHYKPVERFGGEEHFKIQKANDRKKRKLCKDHGVQLIEWSYQEVITEENLRFILNKNKVGISK